MERLPTPTQIRDLARRHGVHPSKVLGQNFVIDANTVRRIVRLAGIGPEDEVIEVGAGLGMLTLALARAARRVAAVEFDRRLIPALEEVVSPAGNVEVVAADAMELDFEARFGPGPHRFVSNLPYNIATPLLAGLLGRAPGIRDFLVMVQREGGERLAAPPGSRTYGAVSVLVAYHCEASLAGRVPPTVFWPQPKVESVLVRMVRRPPPTDVPPGELMTVVRAAFGQRRKTMRNSLASGLALAPEEAEAALGEAGIAPSARAESLSLEEFARLAISLRRP